MAGRYTDEEGGKLHRISHYSPDGEGDIPPEGNAPPCHAPENSRHSSFISGVLGEFLGTVPDRDSLLIAAILLLLIREGGNIRLILALAYILL